MAEDQQLPFDNCTVSNDSTAEGGLYIGGEQTSPNHDAVLPVTSPSTGMHLGTVPKGSREDVSHAISACASVADHFASLTKFERADILHDVADSIESDIDRLTACLTADQGKPLGEARGEVESCVSKFRASAEDIRRDELPTIPSEDSDKTIHLRREPHGIYGVITPWNYPLSTATTYLAPGLAAGNTIVWVPAPETSLVSLEFASIIGEVLPDGVFNVVTGEGPVIGDELVVNDDVDAVAFTGSSDVGEQIADRSGTKPTLLELGGNGPVIVIDDADIDRAVERTATGCFTNAGQICTASERILVHEAIVDEFTKKMVAYANGISVGDPTNDGTDMGPLNNSDVADKMDNHISDAVEAGASVLSGGDRVADAPTDLYFEPTVLADVGPGMMVARNETFGPIAPVETVSDAEEAIRRANSSDFGLSVGVFTESLSTSERFIEELEAGAVNVNDASSYWESHAPVGGYTGKRSGVGRYGGRFTIDEMSQTKLVTVDAM